MEKKGKGGVREEWKREKGEEKKVRDRRDEK